MSQYYLEHPDSIDEDDLVKINHIGFSCNRKIKDGTYPFDPKSQATIKSCFLKLIHERPEEGFMYLCDNKDSKGRNRRITFGKGIRESDPECKFFIHNAQITHILEQTPVHILYDAYSCG